MKSLRKREAGKEQRAEDHAQGLAGESDKSASPAGGQQSGASGGSRRGVGEWSAVRLLQ